MSDQFGRSGQFGSNRHKANLPFCCLPKTIEQRDGRGFQKSLGMYATFQMREKGALTMYSERSSTIVDRLGPPFDFSREPSQSAQSLNFGRCDSRGKVCSDTTAGKIRT